MDTESIVEFMSRPSTYAEHPRNVVVKETHISWVFLTESRAYKLKKPVRFDFLDFSTPERRRQACEDEVRLNRRLAPDVYLDVVPVRIGDAGRLALAGDGRVVDWLVKMRRLCDEHALDRMIAAERVTPKDVDRIAERLTRFYQDLPPVSLEPAVYRGEIESHARDNRRALLESPDLLETDIVKRVHTAQLTFLNSFPDLFDGRVCDGRIVEAHGDLRPEHVYLTPDPVFIDCIEFNAEYRRLDVLDELCFLAMECTLAGAGWVGERVLEHYVESTGDVAPDALRAFYGAYRACVRAKVNLLRSGQVTGGESRSAIDSARRYLELADRIVAPLGPPSMLIVRGPAGVGKTTLAAFLAETLGMEHLQTDAVRRELFGEHGPFADQWRRRYSEENRQRVYSRMLRRAERSLGDGLSVVLDGTYLTDQLRRSAVEVARRLGSRALVVNCDCPLEVAAERIDQRVRRGTSLSEAGPETGRDQRQREESRSEDLPNCQVDTTCALPMMTRKILKALRDRANPR